MTNPKAVLFDTKTGNMMYFLAAYEDLPQWSATIWIRSLVSSIKRRGYLPIGFDPDMIWEAAPTGKRGQQPVYSGEAEPKTVSKKTEACLVGSGFGAEEDPQAIAPIVQDGDGNRIEASIGVATIRFSERDEVTPNFRDIAAGIIRDVSVDLCQQPRPH